MDHTLQSVFHWIAVGKWAVQLSMTEVAMTSHQTTKNLDPSDRSGFTECNYQRQLVVSLHILPLSTQLIPLPAGNRLSSASNKVFYCLLMKAGGWERELGTGICEDFVFCISKQVVYK